MIEYISEILFLLSGFGVGLLVGGIFINAERKKHRPNKKDEQTGKESLTS